MAGIKKGLVANEEQLKHLLEIIEDDPLFSGIHTYPKGDLNNKVIYNACLELERRGLIYRKTDKEDHVFWLPRDKAERYICTGCHKEFGKTTPEEEAIKEKEELFGDIPIEKCVIVCDDCFNKIMREGDKQ